MSAPRIAGGTTPPDAHRHYVPPEKATPLHKGSDRVRRQVEEVWDTHPTLEGAGVHLQRAFGGREVPRFDPFLLLDDFRSNDPEQYRAGFPWHPHRGIQTVTYMLDGYVEHGDSLGNAGRIGPGDVQWMSAGSGIIHQEMPKGHKDVMGGLQLWVNLPAAEKMSRPGYQEFKAHSLPEVASAGARVRVVAGSFGGERGPVHGIPVEPQYLDVRLEAGHAFEHAVPCGHRAIVYVLDGAARFEAGRDPVSDHHVVLFEDGDTVRVETTGKPVRFLLLSGRPLKEPVAWWGPIVMNDQRQLDQAISELQDGTFVKTRPDDEGDIDEMRRTTPATGAT